MFHHPSPSSQRHESLDRRWSSLHRRAEPFSVPAVPTLVVVPHPDDETLLAGGLISTQRSRGVDVQILAVTDGEAAYDPADGLAGRRRREQLDALHRLGVGAESVHRLGLPDGRVGSHVATVTEAIAAADGVGLVVAPWTGDHHCDHEAVGRAAHDAAHRTGCPLVFGLFWTWHRRDPVDLADDRLLALDLDPTAKERRRRALRCHVSQFSDEYGPPQLDDDLVRPVEWPREYFVDARPPAGST